ncbi:MAG: hypothetical protein ACYDEJ_03155 [Desulfitobacteriaceae bacterium]
MYLVFNTNSEAYVANAIISMNMRLSGNATNQWADIQETAEGQFVLPMEEGQTEVVYAEAGKFALLKPDEQHMSYVSGYVEAEKVEIAGEN